ncbi:hypothetical protein HY522_05335 [bacterium]|nr:hypothetical protein [bacterium]
MNDRRIGFVIAMLMLAIGFLAATSEPADAIAAWGRKYSVSCSACHQGQWDLNKDGQEFLRRGHRYEEEKAGPNINDHMSFATKIRYKYGETSSPRTKFEHHAFAIYTGGAMTPQFSYFTEVYLHENAGKQTGTTLPESDDGARTKLAESFLQWTSADGPRYNSVRVGQIMPSLIHRFGGGARLSYSRPLVLTQEDTTLAAARTGYSFFKRDYGAEYTRQHDNLHLALGLVNGGGTSGTFNTTDTDNHRDFYGTVDYVFDDNGSMIGYYFYDGELSNFKNFNSGFTRHAVMSHYVRDNYKLTGFWSWGDRKVALAGPKTKNKMYYGQLSMYELEKYVKMSLPMSMYVRHEFIDLDKDRKVSDLIRQNVVGLQIEPFEYGHLVLEWIGKRDQTVAAPVHRNELVAELQYIW